MSIFFKSLPLISFLSITLLSQVFIKNSFSINTQEKSFDNLELPSETNLVDKGQKEIVQISEKGILR